MLWLMDWVHPDLASRGNCYPNIGDVMCNEVVLPVLSRTQWDPPAVVGDTARR